MKHLIIIIICLSSIVAFSKDTLYVTDSKNIRLFKYQDSLCHYLHNLMHEGYCRNRINDYKGNLSEFCNLIDTLGYGNTADIAIKEKDGSFKLIDKSRKDTCHNLKLLAKVVFSNDEGTWKVPKYIYTEILKPPKQVVILLRKKKDPIVIRRKKTIIKPLETTMRKIRSVEYRYYSGSKMDSLKTFSAY